MAVTKLEARLRKPKSRVTACATPYDTRVWMIKMTGMMASSTSFPALSWEASFVKTANGVHQ